MPKKIKTPGLLQEEEEPEKVPLSRWERLQVLRFFGFRAMGSWGVLSKHIIELPSDNWYIAMENCHRNSQFSHPKWCFSIAVLNYQGDPGGMAL